MMLRAGAAVAALLLFVAAAAGEAAAQYYGPPQKVYRGSPPPPASDYGPPPSGYFVDNEQAPPPPAFATRNGQPMPDAYGHQLGPASAPADDPDVVRPPGAVGVAPAAAPADAAQLPPEDQPEQGTPRELPPELRRQLVNYTTRQPAGTIVIDTPHTFLYLVLGGGKAIRYGIGVGREGFTWSGTERISRMAEWPDWYPPAEMIERQPYLPRVMAGGPTNPLGARALYLGHTLYRIHGTNQPSTIGTFVSSGCIRLLNSDIEDLYDRVQVGTRVVVLPGEKPPEVASAAAASSGSVQPAAIPMRSSATGSITSSTLPPPPRR
ncbi:MAG TPA: L,D-transpeptidase [Pseudolabrys sp.]|nr:L,D-transpeptidase [Pseudolabrys sp.]